MIGILYRLDSDIISDATVLFKDHIETYGESAYQEWYNSTEYRDLISSKVFTGTYQFVTIG